jgi:hypothetical protein
MYKIVFVGVPITYPFIVICESKIERPGNARVDNSERRDGAQLLTLLVILKKKKLTLLVNITP